MGHPEEQGRPHQKGTASTVLEPTVAVWDCQLPVARSSRFFRISWKSRVTCKISQFFDVCNQLISHMKHIRGPHAACEPPVNKLCCPPVFSCRTNTFTLLSSLGPRPLPTLQIMTGGLLSPCLVLTVHLLAQRALPLYPRVPPKGSPCFLAQMQRGQCQVLRHGLQVPFLVSGAFHSFHCHS